MCCAKETADLTRPPERVITTLAEVRALAGELRSLRRRRQEVLVQVPELGAEERHRLQAEIGSYATACGCGQGRVAGILTLVAFILLLATGAIPWRELGVGKVLLLYFGTSLLIMLIGKLYGLVRARLALVKLCRELADRRLPSLKGLSHGSSL
jgi:hypothetical protein